MRRARRVLAWSLALFLSELLQAAAPPAASGPASGAAAEEVAVIGTPHGAIVWRFFETEAPGHAAYVKELIRRGFYDGTTFHRVIPHFVVQGGDPNSKNDDRSDDGEGEADRRLPAEFSRTLRYRPGTVGMARDADPDSGSCQFFIALQNIPRLDGRYTIFGEVIEGLDVARRIADLPRDLNDNPIARVPITARLERRPVPAEIVSAEPGPSGEVLTGPDKPGFYDPKNVLWKPPALRTPSAGGSPGGSGASTPRLDLAVSAEGAVLDVRFPDLATPEPERLRARALAWRFEPATYEGRPRKVRIAIDADGRNVGPPSGGGAPVEVGGGVVAPAPAVRVDLPPGRPAPPRPARLRLTVDAAGAVADAALQASCGDPALDAAAVEAARGLVFTPATRPRPGRSEPEPVAVYLDVEARFVEAPRP